MDTQDFKFSTTGDTGPTVRATESEFLVRGDSLGRYVILGILGSGGMGIVYLAFDPQLDRKVACKVLRKKRDTAAQLRLQREAKSMAKLSHPNVVSVYEVGNDGEQVYVAMELVDGQDIGLWCAAERSEREILAVYLQAGEGLSAAHRAGLIHRDFKPQNVLVDTDGRVLVTDFGLAIQNSELSTKERLQEAAEGMLASDSITKTGIILGTPVYMAPEQHLGKQLDARSDQFSFCVSLYEALCGERPYPGERYDTLREQVVDSTARLLPASVKVSAAVRSAIAKGLSRNPDDRFPTMPKLLESLGYRKRRKRLSGVSRVGIALALMLVGGVAVYILTSSSSSSAASCEVDTGVLDGIWDARVRDGLSTDFEATGVPGALRNFEVFSSTLDRYATELISLRKNICESRKRPNGLDDRAMILELECFQKRRQSLRAVTSAFSGVGALYVERAVEAAVGLPGVLACLDVEALGRGVAAPPKHLARDVAALRATLEQARSFESAGRLTTAITMAELVRDRSLEIPYKPLRAESHLLLGQLLLAAVRVEEAREVLKEAVIAAEECEYARVRAEGLVALANLFGSRSSDAAEAKRYDRLARAAIEHLEESHELVFKFGVAQAQRKFLEAEFGEGLAVLLAVLRKVESWPGEYPLWRAEIFHRMVWFYNELGDFEGSNRTAAEAHTIIQSALGDDHPRRMRYLSTLGNTFRVLQQEESAHEIDVIAWDFWGADSAEVFVREVPGYIETHRKVSGRVVDGVGVPVSNAVVVCGSRIAPDAVYLDAAWSGYILSARKTRVVRTDNDGQFKCEKTTTRRLAVVAEHKTAGRSLAQFFPAASDDVDGLEVVLLETGGLSGQVFDPSAGIGIRYVIVVPEGDELLMPVYRATTAIRDDFYRIKRLAVGRYHVRVGGEGDTGKSNVMVHRVEITAGSIASLNFRQESGTAGIRISIRGKHGLTVQSVQVIIVTGHHDVHTAAEFGEKVFASDVTLREKYLTEGELLHYDDLVPGAYTMCLVPLAGDYRNVEFFENMSRESSASQLYYCHHLQLEADIVFEDTTKVPPYRNPQ